jgi:hypothetical protein
MEETNITATLCPKTVTVLIGKKMEAYVRICEPDVP